MPILRRLIIGVAIFAGRELLAKRGRKPADRRVPNSMRNTRRKSNRRKPPEAGIPVPAVPPKGPLPKQGGAEAPLEFD